MRLLLVLLSVAVISYADTCKDLYDFWVRTIPATQTVEGCKTKNITFTGAPTFAVKFVSYGEENHKQYRHVIITDLVHQYLLTDRLDLRTEHTDQINALECVERTVTKSKRTNKSLAIQLFDHTTLNCEPEFKQFYKNFKR